jgi:glutamate dehydrogenase/leucine dehydrogenase
VTQPNNQECVGRYIKIEGESMEPFWCVTHKQVLEVCLLRAEIERAKEPLPCGHPQECYYDGCQVCAIEAELASLRAERVKMEEVVEAAKQTVELQKNLPYSYNGILVDALAAMGKEKI